MEECDLNSLILGVYSKKVFSRLCILEPLDQFIYFENGDRPERQNKCSYCGNAFSHQERMQRNMSCNKLIYI